MLHGHQCRVDGHTGYDVTNYFRPAFAEVRKTAENAASDSFGSNFSGAAFCLPQQLVSLLLLGKTRRCRCRHSQQSEAVVYLENGLT